LDAYSSFCELTTRSFTGRGSFALFAPLKQRHRFTIKLSFATRERNGLLFYNGRYNDKHDFVSLEIIDGHVEFAFSLGTNITRVRASPVGGTDVSDGNWHDVTVAYLNRTVTLSIGVKCDVELSVLYGARIGNYSCAGRDTQVLDDRCQDVTETCHRFLDLTGPFHLGGLSTPLSADHHTVLNSHFIGCIRNLYIDGQMVDLATFAWNNGTVEGCPAKAKFCLSSPCQNSGTCTEVWNGYHCDCGTGWMGKDCSQPAPGHSWRLHGQGYLVFTKASHGLANVRSPWLNALSFRTRHLTATLMSVELGAGTSLDPKVKVVIRVENGIVHYTLSQQTLMLPDTVVSDGQWHYLEVKWLTGEVVLTLDHGKSQISWPVSDSIMGQTVGRIVVGGILSAADVTPVIVYDGFVGCIKTVRVGSVPGILLSGAEIYNVEIGCNISRKCGVGLCPGDRSYCVEEWNQTSCVCQNGRIGTKCDRICDRYNPCHKGAGECVDTVLSTTGYQCRCNERHTGRYCELSTNQTCPASWWGSPVCGPCNCPKDRGFDPNCDKMTGRCNCKIYHYRVNDTCYPCDCYDVGSHHRSCDLFTGQCSCRSGVIGRRCDMCTSRFAQVTEHGCEVVYDSCPRSFRADIWWRRTAYGSVARQDCPLGATGLAVRLCNGTDGWLEPDMSDCTSTVFLELQNQLSAIERKRLEINTYIAKTTVLQLKEAMYAAQAPMTLHENDVDITARLIVNILRYESHQTGLNLTHTQDRNFIQHIINSVGRILDPKYTDIWTRIQRKRTGALVDLMNAVENYTLTLAHNMLQTFTQPFDAVHENIVLGLDFIAASNFSSIPIPKYNNKVQNPDIFDTSTKATLPMKMLQSPSSQIEGSATFNGIRLSAITGYALYKTIGTLLLPEFCDTVRSDTGAQAVVNSALFSLNVISGNTVDHVSVTTEPIVFEFRQLTVVNRSNPRCVYWDQSDRTSAGHWSSDGCELISRTDLPPYKYVQCQCSHLSTFAVVMDVSDDEMAVALAFTVEISTYSGLGVALICLAIAFGLFCFVRRIDSNANSIHLNLVASLFIANAVFLAGIDRTEYKVLCTLVAISLHYFFLCSFAWMFVESLHIYRRMTDIRDVNHGPMRFYYVVGYVIPGIIVGLSVGLNTDGYGNKDSCWLKTSDVLIWSFAGPICCIVAANIVVFIAAGYASCQGHYKHADVDSSYLKYGLRASVILLPLMSLAVTFALLSVNNASIVAFHYLFNGFTCLQAIFIVIAYIAFSKEMKQQIHYSLYRMKASASTDISDQTKCIRQDSHYSSAASFDAGLNSGRYSSSSSTSHSLSKAAAGSGGPQDSLHHGSGHKHRSPRSARKRQPTDDVANPQNLMEAEGIQHAVEDSDSDLSDQDEPRLEVASSHSSDDDEFDEQDVRGGWNKTSQVAVNSRGSRNKQTSSRSHHRQKDSSNRSKLSPSHTQHRQAAATPLVSTGKLSSPAGNRQHLGSPRGSSSRQSPASSGRQHGLPTVTLPPVSTVSPPASRQLAVKIERHVGSSSESA
jgi:cadherin EGF LAG seven-pass G-type receptor 1